MPKLTIGLPIYDGGDLVPERLDSILSQTFSDFELLITVDPSPDNSVQICEDFAKKDNRIRLVKQNKKMGWMWSFDFLIQNANTEYFTLVAVDDIWTSNFLEKIMNEFEKNKKNLVCVFPKINRYGGFLEFQIDTNDSILTKFYKKFRQRFRPFLSCSLEGSIEKNVTISLRNQSYGFLVGIMKTDIIKKSSCYDKPFFVCDWGFALNILKYGNAIQVDDASIKVGTDGISSKGIFSLWKNQPVKWNEYFLPYSTFSIWVIKNFGLKIFLKNLDYFIWLNFTGVVAIIHDLLRITKIVK